MNPVLKSLGEGQPAIGGWMWYPNTLLAEVLGKTGIPFFVIDAQHGGAGWETLMGAIQALDLGGAAAIVRTGWIDEAMIMRALDLGALGVIVPMVSTAADARRMAAALRYPPEGSRSYGATRPRHASPAEANRDVIGLAMIETAEGLENVEEIAATPGVDGLFVGPADLALSLGLGLPGPGEPHPQLAEAYDRIVAAAKRHNRFVGTLAFSEVQLHAFLDRGFRFMTLGSDRAWLAKGAAADLAVAKAAAAKYQA